MPHRSFVVRFLAAVVVFTAMAAPLVLRPLPNVSAAPAIDGPDVSHYQHHGGNPINWNAVAKSGKEFEISKATEGTSFTDPYFATDYAASYAAGLVHGAYHFAHPGLPIASTAMAQAQYFYSVVGAVDTKDTLPPALDLEQTGGLSAGQLVTWAQDFLLDMRTLTGRTPMLYTYPNFWQNDLRDPIALARYPLWMAAYGTSTAPVADLWQYTDNAHIKGFPKAHGKPAAVDESTFLGTTGFPWATLSDGTVETPWTPASPGAPVSARGTAEGTSVKVSWLPGDTGTSPITGYTITASPGGAVQTVGGTTFSATFKGLSTKTAYTFTVAAANSIGTGASSKPTTPVTPTIPTVLSAQLPSSVVYGNPLPLQVTLTRRDNKAGLADQKVLVFRRTSTSAPWRQIRHLTTNADGQANAVIQPRRSAQLEAVFPGANGVARSTSFENYVVTPSVTAVLSSATVPHGGQVTLSGTAAPFTAGQKVVREVQVNGSWQVLAKTTIGRKGRFSFTIHPKNQGTDVYRVAVPATKRLGTGHSPTVTLTVT
jgi:GH25 family lysozyme M1 (1,4-beta-N-acetylmuramidase)